MRRIYFGTASLLVGLATLMWATASINAQHGGHGGGHAPAGHAPAHVGSIHYAARPAPTRVVPEVHGGAVRSEHYADAASRGAYRNPYRDEYFRHFRPGYRSFVLGDAQYYGYDSLPDGYQEVVVGGITYYVYDDVYYQPYIFEGQTVYVVAPDQ